jgi:guanylate kinase
MLQEARDTFVVVSGPSGIGKTTLIRNMLEADLSDTGASIIVPPIVSTRSPRAADRPGEIIFVSPEDFSALYDRGEFVVTYEKHGNSYGLRHCDIAPAASAASGSPRIFVQCLSAKTWDSLRKELAATHNVFVCRLEASPQTVFMRLDGRADDISENELRSRQNTSFAMVPPGIDHFINAEREPHQVRDHMMGLIRKLVSPAITDARMNNMARISAERPLFRGGRPSRKTRVPDIT